MGDNTMNHTNMNRSSASTNFLKHRYGNDRHRMACRDLKYHKMKILKVLKMQQKINTKRRGKTSITH